MLDGWLVPINISDQFSFSFFSFFFPSNVKNGWEYFVDKNEKENTYLKKNPKQQKNIVKISKTSFAENKLLAKQGNLKNEKGKRFRDKTTEKGRKRKRKMKKLNVIYELRNKLW